MRIESDEEDVRELAYESQSDASDDEFQNKRKKKKVSHSFSQPREFVIHLFGATETGVSVRCDVTGFHPTMYIRLPEEKTGLAVDGIKEYINRQGIPMGQLTFKRITKKIFYGFTANTAYPFLQIHVPSLSMFRNLRGLFLDENQNFATKRPLDGAWKGKTVEVFEANIDPMLRFLHGQNIQPCGWVGVKEGIHSFSELDDKHIIIECDYTQIQPAKAPRVSAPFLTASWDIECFSMTGDFPLAKRTWSKAAKDLIRLGSADAVNMIVNSLSTGQTPVSTLPKGMTPIYCQLKKSLDAIRVKLGGVEEDLCALIDSMDDEQVSNLEKFLEKTLKSMVYLVGDPAIQIGTTLTRGTVESIERHLFVFPDCAAIPGIVVHAYPTEREMILAWFEWLIEVNPDILIGYNVFGFDESYLWERAEQLKLITANSPIHQLTRLFDLSGEMKLEEKFLSSSAM
jgi:DNA polymerase elongation subunit (family B)